MSLVETAKFPTALVTESDMLNWKNQFSSNPLPTLSADITSTATSFTLTAGTGQYLPSDNFIVSVDNEIMFVGSRSADILSGVVRAFEGTAAVAHLANATVLQTVSAKSHNQVVSEVKSLESFLGVNARNLMRSSVQAVSSNVTIDDTYAVVLVTTGSNNVIITLPAPSPLPNKMYTIKKVDSGTGTVIINGNAIDQWTSYQLINPWQYVQLITDGTAWFIIGRN